MTPKAILSAIVAVLITFGTTLADSDSVSWRTVVTALIAAVAAHQTAYWAPYESKSNKPPLT